MKKAVSRLFLLVMAGAIGLSAGFLLRSRPVRPGTGVPHVTASSARALPTAKPQPGRLLQDDSRLATRLERDLSASTGVTRWLYWLEAIEKAGPGDFLRLARLAQDNPTALRFVAARWAELYPTHLFDTLVTASQSRGSRPFHEMLSELARTLFRDWPKRDPESAIAALSGPNDFGMRSSWRIDVAESVMETDPECGLRLMSDWDVERFGPRMTAVQKWAAANPRHAAEFTLQNRAGYVSELTMETIGKEWARTDPGSALQFAASNPGELATSLARSTLKEWAARSLTDAASWLAQTDTRMRDLLSPAFVEAWAKKDAPNALAWCDANLSGSSLLQAVGAVLKGAADTDVAGAAQLVASLTPSTARAEAAVAVAKKWFPQLSAGEPIKPETIAWLSDLDSYSIKRVLDNIQWGWATTDPKSMAAFLGSVGPEEASDSACSLVARELARKNPLEALQWANTLPGQRGLTAGSDAFATWRSTQADAASQWLNALPRDDPRREPFFASAVRTIAWGDPQAAQQFAAMSSTERATALGVVEKMSLPETRRTTLLDALKAH